VLLLIGIISVYLGTLLLVLAQMNRATGETRTWLSALMLYVAGGLVIQLMLLLLEYIHIVEMHGARFYRVVCWSVPLVFAAIRVASTRRWACTSVATVYTV